MWKSGIGELRKRGFCGIFRWMNDLRSGIFPEEKLEIEGGGVSKAGSSFLGEFADPLIPLGVGNDIPVTFQ